MYKLIALLLFALIAPIPLNADNPFLRGKMNEIQTLDNSEGSRAVIIVMDASGSMADPAQGANSKMLMAKEVLEKVLAKIDPAVRVGLRVYGSSPASPDISVACRDSILLVPAGTGNRQQMVNKLREIKPSGATPISYAMREAISDLKRIDVEKKTIVLISDGMDTCGSDPCALATSMEKAGLDVQFNVVGFGVFNDPLATKQLDCIATATHGKFYTADASAQLTESILDGINSYSLSVTGTIKESNPSGK